MALSADGTQIAFVANRERTPMLWVRALDSAESRVLDGTEGASYPFWSADGRTLGEGIAAMEAIAARCSETIDAGQGR